MTVRNNADAEVDYYLWPGLTASQKGSYTYKDWNGNSQWYMVKDTSNNWALNSAVGGLDSFKAYQSTNSGDTYINASNTSGHVRLNYESGSGAETDVYANGTLIAKFGGTTSIAFPGLAASSGYNCLQIDNSGYITNTGSGCFAGGGTVTSFAAPAASWPAWLVPTVTNAGTTPSLAVAASATGAGSVVLANGPTFTGNATTFANGVAAEQDVTIQPGTGADQVGAFAWSNYSGTSQWKLRKDASNYLRLTDVVNALDREVLYQNGQTVINAGAGANPVVVNGSSGSGTSGLLVESGGSSPSAVLTVSGSGNTTAAGFVAGKFMIGSGTMSLTAGAAAGTGPSITCASSHVCDGVSGTVALTTGTSTATGKLATLSFPNTHSNQANCVVTPTLSGTGLVTTITWSESPTALTLTANTALAASTTYQVRYWCGGN